MFKTCLLIFTSACLMAETLSDNLSAAAGGAEVASGSRILAAKFLAPAAASLTAVTLPLANTVTGVAAVSIYSESGLHPGTLAGPLSSPASYSPTAAATTFTSSGIALTAGATYYIVLQATSGTFEWSWTASNTGAGSGFQPVWGVSADGGSTWSTQLGYPMQALIETGSSSQCAVTLGSSSAAIPTAGATASVSVTAAGACGWTAVSNSTFLSITAGASGTGNGTVTYQVAPNTGAARTGTFSVNGQTFTVTQEAACTYSLGSLTSAVGAGGGSGSFTVTAPSGCAWTAASGAAWIVITSGASGSGSGSVSFTVAANTGAGRTGTVTAAGIGHTVNQAGAGSTAPAVSSYSPAAGSGTSTTLVLTVMDSDGFADIDVVNVLINTALDGRQGCYLAYSRPNNVLYLVNDTGDGLLPGVVPAAAATVSNNSCSLQAGASSVSTAGNSLTLTLSLTFSQTAFQGSKIVYGAARDASGGNSGWLTLGTWLVPFVTPQAIALQSYTPSSGTGTTGTFTAVFRHASAAANITNAQILINRALDGDAACYLTYIAAANQLYLVADAGPSAPLLGPITPGVSGSMQNSQCQVTGAAVAVSGADLSLSVNLTFLSPLKGTVLAHAAAQRYLAATLLENTGWRAAGIWNVP
ncbi:MAG: BACON domain-containing protein [Bryobacteraceae bacterium]